MLTMSYGLLTGVFGDAGNGILELFGDGLYAPSGSASAVPLLAPGQAAQHEPGPSAPQLQAAA